MPNVSPKDNSLTLPQRSNETYFSAVALSSLRASNIAAITNGTPQKTKGFVTHSRKYAMNCNFPPRSQVVKIAFLQNKA